MRAERSALGACPSVGLPANGARGGRGRASREFGDGRRSSGECGGGHRPRCPPAPPGSPPPPPLPRVAATPTPHFPSLSARPEYRLIPAGTLDVSSPPPSFPPFDVVQRCDSRGAGGVARGAVTSRNGNSDPACCPPQPGHPRGQPHPGAARMSRDKPPPPTPPFFIPPAQRWGLSTGGTRSGAAVGMGKLEGGGEDAGHGGDASPSQQRGRW